MAILAFDGDIDFHSVGFSFLNVFDSWEFRDNARFRLAAAPLLGLTKPYSFEDVEVFVGGSLAAPDWAASLMGTGLKQDLDGFATGGRLTGFLSYDYTNGLSALIVDFNLSYVEFESVYMSATLVDDALLFDKLLAGHDRITCGGGDDLVWGHTGNDSIFGNDGDDSLWGDAGNDNIYGGADNDHLIGNLGQDSVYGGAGDDEAYGEDGQDVLYGESGNDTLDGWVGNDKLYGGTGDDTAFGGEGMDKLFGDAGADSLAGNEGKDSLYGGADADTLFGSENNDLIFGDAGNDWVSGGWHADVIYGGAGNDILAGNAGEAVDSGDYLNDGGDKIYGDAGHDMLLGEYGNDSLYGGTGNDTLIGGVGTDVLAGGRDMARDVFVFADATDSGLGLGRDRVVNFKSGTDIFNFENFDANAATAAIDSFVFNGSLAAAYTLWTVDIGADLLLRGDVTGDGVADFEIQIKAINSLLDADFLF